jgi:hypothetical protein
VRPRRIILLAAAAACAAAAIIAVVMYERLDSIVRRAIEERGSAITQTAVRVKSVDVSLRDGSGALRVTAAHVFLDAIQSAFDRPTRFGGVISVQLAPRQSDLGPSVIRDPIHAPRVTCEELNHEGMSNVEVIRDAAEGARRQPGTTDTPGPAAA